MRVDDSKAAGLLEYLESKVPTDTESGERVTSNPLMLSMMISIYERQQGNMPKTAVQVYETATTAMLKRIDLKQRGVAASIASVPYLTRLLERTFFEAHADQGQLRVIGEDQLRAAAIGLEAPERLAEIQQRRAPLEHRK